MWYIGYPYRGQRSFVSLHFEHMVQFKCVYSWNRLTLNEKPIKSKTKQKYSIEEQCGWIYRSNIRIWYTFKPFKLAVTRNATLNSWTTIHSLPSALSPCLLHPTHFFKNKYARFHSLKRTFCWSSFKSLLQFDGLHITNSRTRTCTSQHIETKTMTYQHTNTGFGKHGWRNQTVGTIEVSTHPSGVVGGWGCCVQTKLMVRRLAKCVFIIFAILPLFPTVSACAHIFPTQGEQKAKRTCTLILC